MVYCFVLPEVKAADGILLRSTRSQCHRRFTALSHVVQPEVSATDGAGRPITRAASWRHAVTNTVPGEKPDRQPPCLRHRLKHYEWPVDWQRSFKISVHSLMTGDIGYTPGTPVIVLSPLSTTQPQGGQTPQSHRAGRHHRAGRPNICEDGVVRGGLRAQGGTGYQQRKMFAFVVV